VLALSMPRLGSGAVDVLMSLPRFLLTAFPVRIFLSTTTHRTRVACAVSIPLLVSATAVFLCGAGVA
jgi:hypothetical protein